MSVDTRRVANRRILRFRTLDDVVNDAQRLATGEVRPMGNWTLGMALKHLALFMNASLDGVRFRPPLWVRVVGPMMKQRVLSRPMSPGFELPDGMAHEFVPDRSTSTEAGLAALVTAVQRLKTEEQRAPHTVFGQLTREQWDRLHLRHAELHLSFMHPLESGIT